MYIYIYREREKERKTETISVDIDEQDQDDVVFEDCCGHVSMAAVQLASPAQSNGLLGRKGSPSL